MKRSEMINIIRQCQIDGYIKPEEILTVIELHGMNPPMIRKILSEEEREDLSSTDDIGWYTGKVYVNEWEQE